MSGWRWAVVAIVCAVVATPLLFRILDARSDSFRSQFARSRDALLARPTRAAPPVTESELNGLPPLMQNYLRRAGAVGRPHVRNMRVAFRAQMRSSATAAWMQSEATQYEFFDPPARLFYMNASLFGVPLDILHRYVDAAATFQVRVVSLFPMVHVKGAGLTHDETVTLMNDVLVMAPAAVLDLPFTFETRGPHAVRATFANAGFTVSAELAFDDAGDLIGFVSNDRAHSREAGPAAWSTPLSGYREVNGIRIPALADANWIDASGEWTYGRFEIRDIAYNVTQ